MNGFVNTFLHPTFLYIYLLTLPLMLTLLLSLITTYHCLHIVVLRRRLTSAHKVFRNVLTLLHSYCSPSARCCRDPTAYACFEGSGKVPGYQPLPASDPPNQCIVPQIFVTRRDRKFAYRLLHLPTALFVEASRRPVIATPQSLKAKRIRSRSKSPNENVGTEKSNKKQKGILC